MIVAALAGIVGILALMFCMCTCCILRCFRPQRSPGPAWYPDKYGRRRIVNRWNAKAGLDSLVGEIKDMNAERYHASFGNIRGFGFDDWRNTKSIGPPGL